MSTLDWWRTGAIYQVYIRSFADGNGDGTGDVAGLRAKLPYLADLGIDGIWINPWYPSPCSTAATTWPTTATSTRRTARLRTPTR